VLLTVPSPDTGLSDEKVYADAFEALAARATLPPSSTCDDTVNEVSVGGGAGGGPPIRFPTPGIPTAPTQLNALSNQWIVVGCPVKLSVEPIPYFSEIALMMSAEVPVPETTMPT
jgi:hypothetical protein